MKTKITAITVFFISFFSSSLFAQKSGQQLFVDVHELNSQVKFEDVAAAHKKDLATQGKYGVSFIKYWVDESKGLVYCLSSAKDSASVVQTHKEAHGLLPARVYGVTEGQAATLQEGKDLY